MEQQINMEQKINITQFLDDTGRIVQMPRKRMPRMAVLQYLAEKFDKGCFYSEKQVNEICEQWHTFGDFFLLRRELVEGGLLSREKDGSKYWRTEE